MCALDEVRHDRAIVRLGVKTSQPGISGVPEKFMGQQCIWFEVAPQCFWEEEVDGLHVSLGFFGSTAYTWCFFPWSAIHIVIGPLVAVHWADTEGVPPVAVRPSKPETSCPAVPNGRPALRVIQGGRKSEAPPAAG
jgi:hypothetical protein